MKPRLQAWWQAIRRHPVRSIIILVFILLVVFALCVYLFGWGWTGFNGGFSQTTTTSTTHGITTATVQPPGKTFWDWLQLLIIPLVLAVAALLFNFANSRTEQKIALDKQREDLLQAYLDRISDLLLKEKLRSSEVDDEVRNVARVRTIILLTQLDSRRIEYVFAFLIEAGLMSVEPNSSIVNFSEADLSDVDWSRAIYTKVNLSGAYFIDANLNHVIFSDSNLSGAIFDAADLSYAEFEGADLSGANFWNTDLFSARLLEANLSNAHLREANLRNANFARANLKNADLSEADLSEANFSGADLSEAKVTDEQLNSAKSLKGATMPDGSIHP